MMAQNMIEDSKRKYEEARQYLIELMQAYGQRPIFVKTDKNGELVQVIGKSFVKHQTEAIGIDYPSNAVRKKCNKRKNPQLDTEKHTLVFLEADVCSLILLLATLSCFRRSLFSASSA